MKTSLLILIVVGTLAAASLFPAALAYHPENTDLVLSTTEQLTEDLKTAPCKNADRAAAAAALLQKMGVPPADIKIEKFKDVADIVVTKTGSQSDRILVGAHYDKVQAGCGAVDNWSGVVTVAHLYRTVKNAALNKTIQFALFGKEESGLVGSAAMVNSFSKEEALSYCDMINIDSLGLGAAQAADNMSSPKLVKLAEEDAKVLKMPFGHAAIPGADADSSSFLQHKIPAITLHGLRTDWDRILHTDRDTFGALKPASVYLGYRLALKMLVDLDASPCDKYK